MKTWRGFAPIAIFPTAVMRAPASLAAQPSATLITRTRLQTGEAGSSRQVQLAVKLFF